MRPERKRPPPPLLSASQLRELRRPRSPRRTPSPPSPTSEVVRIAHPGPAGTPGTGFVGFSAREASGWAAIGAVDDHRASERCAMYAAQTAAMAEPPEVDMPYTEHKDRSVWRSLSRHRQCKSGKGNREAGTGEGDQSEGGDGRWDGKDGQAAAWNVGAKMRHWSQVRQGEAAMDGKHLNKWRKEREREAASGPSSSIAFFGRKN